MFFIKVPNIKFQENLSSGSCADTCKGKDRRTRRDEANRRFLQQWEGA